MSWSGPRGGSRKDAAGAQEEGGSTEGQCGAESTEGACLGNAVRMWRQRMQQAEPSSSLTADPVRSGASCSLTL